MTPNDAEATMHTTRTAPSSTPRAGLGEGGARHRPRWSPRSRHHEPSSGSRLGRGCFDTDGWTGWEAEDTVR